MFNGTLIHIYEQRKGFLYWDAQWLTGERLRTYCSAINPPGTRIYGFIDGTHRSICQSSTMDQKLFYSGYKNVHSIKFQMIMAPDGLIIHLAGCLFLPYYFFIIIDLFILFISLFIYYFYFYIFILFLIYSFKDQVRLI